MSSQPFEVVTGGEAMGLLLAADDIPLTTASRYDALIAGAESNLAIGLSRLGHRVSFFGRVGADVFGDRIRRDLRGEGVDVSELHTDPDRPTGLMFRDTARGSPISVLYRRQDSAATGLVAAELPRAMIETARVLHVTGITAALSDSAYDATLTAMRIARRAGVRVSFDPNLRLRLATASRWAEIIDALVREADVVLTGADEAEIFCPGANPAAWCGDRGATTVVVKHGAFGAAEHDLTGQGGPDAVVRQGARTVPVVDPVGAGDGFDAGWLSAWLRGLTAQERLQEACAVASIVVATRGDSTGLPDAATRDRVLREGADVHR